MRKKRDVNYAAVAVPRRKKKFVAEKSKRGGTPPSKKKVGGGEIFEDGWVERKSPEKSTRTGERIDSRGKKRDGGIEGQQLQDSQD